MRNEKLKSKMQGLPGWRSNDKQQTQKTTNQFYVSFLTATTTTPH
jgi:hypothetical protein